MDDSAVVPGFSGYSVVGAGLQLALDSRSPYREYTAGSGARLELWGAFLTDPEDVHLSFAR